MDDALLIPVEALALSVATTGVYLMKNNQPSFNPVTVGQTNWEKAVILEGLAEGDSLVLGGGEVRGEVCGLRSEV